jgi:hypothetical protein
LLEATQKFLTLMKKNKHPLQLTLASCLQANLGGLNEAHTRKLQKLATEAAGKLTKKFVKLQGKEQKAADEAATAAQPKAASRTNKRAPLSKVPSRSKAVSQVSRRKVVGNN